MTRVQECDRHAIAVCDGSIGWGRRSILKELSKSVVHIPSAHPVKRSVLAQQVFTFPCKSGACGPRLKNLESQIFFQILQPRPYPAEGFSDPFGGLIDGSGFPDCPEYFQTSVTYHGPAKVILDPHL